MYKVDEMQQFHQQMQFHKDVIFTGRVEDDQLNDLLGSALALIFVPTFEGFGIPIIEAMQCGVPVICSNTTSMPEVAGKAALMVDPFDVSSIRDAMKKIYTDKELRSRLITAGMLRAQDFTWERSAQDLWNSIQKCL
jgi:glycosyltransferase involved in cell wall biosynthesis